MARSRARARAELLTVLPADRRRGAGPLDRLTIEGRRLEMAVGDRLLDASLTRTIEGPEIVTVALYNGDGGVLRSGILGERIMRRQARIELDGLGYIASGASKNGETLEIPFETEASVVLKQHGTGDPKRVSRDSNHTCASFCAGLIRDAGVPVIVLDETIVQPIEDAGKLARELKKAKRQAAGTGRSRHTGVKGSGLTIKGQPATLEQRRNIATFLAVGQQGRAPERPLLAGLIAGIAEGGWQTDLRNFQTGDAAGPFQILRSTAAALGISQTDVAAGSRAFLFGINGRSFTGGPGAVALARQNPSWGPGDIANAVEGGGAGAGFYAAHLDEAKRWLQAGTDGQIASGTAWVRDYTFERRKKESTWAACWRLLVEERRWRLFTREGVVIIASDLALARARPSITLAEHTEAVPEGIDFEWHRALRVGEATGQLYAGRYQADPGEVVEVTDLPQLDRVWLLASATVPLFESRPLIDFTLAKPRPPKAEPNPQVDSIGPIATGTAGGVGRLKAACREIDRQDLPYVWGGGHAHAGTPDRGDGSDPGVGYDCSGAVGAALAMAGMGYRIGEPIPGSGTMASSWGEPGQGQDFTLWANNDHVFLHFADGTRFDTGGGPPSGPHLRDSHRATAGFTPRRWPGA